MDINVQDIVIHCIEETSQQKVEMEMNLFDDLNLSSMEILEVIAELEDKLKVTLIEDEISNVSTVAELVTRVNDIKRKSEKNEEND